MTSTLEYPNDPALVAKRGAFTLAKSVVKFRDVPVTGVVNVVHCAEAFGQITKAHCVPEGVMKLLAGTLTLRLPVASIDPFCNCGVNGWP